jgi:ribonuclease P protein component
LLPRESRLRSSEEIRQVVSSGNRASSSIGTLHYLPASDTRFAIIVSKAVGNAVTRNLVKRRVRAILAEQLNTAPNIWGAFRMKPGADQLDHQTLKREIAALLSRIK